MIKYHKIQSVYKRDPETKFKTFLEGDFSIPEFEYLKDNEWIWTEKVDGTNTRVMYDGKKITFGGKTDNAQIPSGLVNRLNERFSPLFDVFYDMFGLSYVCLYGEGYGPKIQTGGKYRKDQDFVLFDVNINDWWLQRGDVEKIAEKLRIDVVPIIGRGTLQEMVEMVKKGFKSQWGDFIAEGIVARPSTELRTRRGDRIITKIKHKDFS